MEKLVLRLSERKNTIYGFVLAAVILVVMFATAARGDEIDDSLPQDSPTGVKESARQAIGNGLDRNDIVKLTQSMLQHHFDPKQIKMAHAIMVEAKISDMPVLPLINKAFEGMAKNVDPALVLQAMEAVQSRNAFAFHSAARLSRDKSRINLLGRSLSAGLSAGLDKSDADKITKLLERRAASMTSDQSFHLALECLHTARDVARLGVTSQTTTDMIASALSNGFSGQDMSAMRNAYLTEARQSDPLELARGYAESIQSGNGLVTGPGGVAGNGKGSGGSGYGQAGAAGSAGSAGGSGGSGSDGDGGGNSGGSGGSGSVGGPGGSGGPGSGGGGAGPGGSR